MKKKKESSPPEEWDPRQGMGILPEDIPLTQNIGCVSGKTSKSTDRNNNTKK